MHRSFLWLHIFSLIGILALENLHFYKSFSWLPGGSGVKASALNAGDLGSIPGSGRFPGEGNGNPLQYSCLENPLDGGAGGLQSMGRKESHTTERLHFHFHLSWLSWRRLHSLRNRTVQDALMLSSSSQLEGSISFSFICITSNRLLLFLILLICWFSLLLSSL